MAVKDKKVRCVPDDKKSCMADLKDLQQSRSEVNGCLNDRRCSKIRAAHHVTHLEAAQHLVSQQPRDMPRLRLNFDFTLNEMKRVALLVFVITAVPHTKDMLAPAVTSQSQETKDFNKRRRSSVIVAKCCTRQAILVLRFICQC